MVIRFPTGYVVTAEPCDIDIALKSLSSSNSTLSDELQLVAKVVTEDNVISESNPSMSAGSHHSWTLQLECEM